MNMNTSTSNITNVEVSTHLQGYIPSQFIKTNYRWHPSPESFHCEVCAQPKTRNGTWDCKKVHIPEKRYEKKIFDRDKVD